MNITAGQKSNSPAYSKEERQSQCDREVLLKAVTFFVVTALLSNIAPAHQTGKNEDEYDPIHDVDDAKGYQ